MQERACRYNLIYESDSIVVSADLRATRSVIVGLSPMREGLKVVRFGDGIFQKLGYSGVFVTAKADHWWQIDDRDALCAAVRRAVSPYVERVAYGVSMGAYGALSLGADMDCTRVVAVAPQTVLSDPTVPLHHSWRTMLNGRPILRDDVVSDLRGLVPEIIYDPFQELDTAHVRYLAARRPVVELCLPFAGHMVLRTLLECDVLPDVTRRLLAGRHDNLLLEYRSYRARSRNCILNAGLSLCHRGRWDRALKVADALDRRGEVVLAERLTVIATKWRAKAEHAERIGLGSAWAGIPEALG